MDKTIDFYGRKDDASIQIVPPPPEILEGKETGSGLVIFGSNTDIASPSKNFICKRMFRFYGISHLISGRGWRWLEGGEKEFFSKGNFVITTPGLIHDYGGDGVEYREDALSFCGPLADALCRAGILEQGLYFAGKGRPLLPIIDLSHSHREADRIEAGIRLQNLLLNIYHQNLDSGNSCRDRVSSLLEEIRQSPDQWWSVSSMAEYCCLSVSQFRVIFKKTAGMSPKRYVDGFKNKLACQYLISTDFSVKKIASLLGYGDSLHFSRKFSDLNGMSPTRYREQMTGYS